MSSAVSCTRTTGQPSNISAAGPDGCGTESISLKTSDCAAKMPLYTRKSVCSARTTSFPSLYQMSVDRTGSESFTSKDISMKRERGPKKIAAITSASSTERPRTRGGAEERGAAAARQAAP
jgi:hypothetical protein